MTMNTILANNNNIGNISSLSYIKIVITGYYINICCKLVRKGKITEHKGISNNYWLNRRINCRKSLKILKSKIKMLDFCRSSRTVASCFKLD